MDAQLARYQSINKESSETAMSYVSELSELENKLTETGKPVPEKEKCRALLRGLRDDLKVSVEVIRATDKPLAESISLLVVQKNELKRRKIIPQIMINHLSKEKRKKALVMTAIKREISRMNVITIHEPEIVRKSENKLEQSIFQLK